MTNWTPQTNRIPTGLLTPDELAALKAWPHGWECCTVGAQWDECDKPAWLPYFIYRAKPAPPKPLSEEEFMGAVWGALKADASDISKQARILAAFRAAETAGHTTMQGVMKSARVEGFTRLLGAAVAAALERAATWLENENPCFDEKADAIRAMIEPTGRAALDAVVAERTKELEAKLAKMVEALEAIVVDDTWGLEHKAYMKCRAALAAYKSPCDGFATQKEEGK